MLESSQSKCSLTNDAKSPFEVHNPMIWKQHLHKNVVFVLHLTPHPLLSDGAAIIVAFICEDLAVNNYLNCTFMFVPFIFTDLLKTYK